MLGYAAPIFSPSLTLAEASVWRGKRADPIGFYWLGARYYDPLAGRFLSPDPGGHEAGYDLYSFAHGDPVNQFDPDGRFGKSVGQAMQSFNDNTFGDNIVQQMHRQEQLISASSQLVNMVPVVGAAKMFWEMNTMHDAFTGERQDGNQYLQALGMVLNVIPVLTSGMSLAAESGGGAVGSGTVWRAESQTARWQVSGTGSTMSGSTGGGKGVVINVNNAERALAAESGCFVAGTLVACENGFEEIQNIKTEERVWSRNEVSEEWELKPVQAVFVHDYKGDVITLEVGDSVIEATGNHPFWIVAGADLEYRPVGSDVPLVESNGLRPGRWVAARDVKPGDVLLSRENGPAVVELSAARQDRLPVYNIQVADNHDYAVSRECILVHNKSWQVAPVPREGGGFTMPDGSFSPTAAKSIPNPGGKLGDALTRQTAANVINDLKAGGFTDVSQEVLFQKGPLGLENRFADIVGVNQQTGESLIINIGKQTKSGIPLMRERRALDDIIFSPTIQNYPNSRLLFIEKGASGLPPGL